jgi:CHAD domain-containing protein
LLELELELKSGRRAALWELALELAGDESDGIALLPLTESKAARGVRLARGEGLAPVKAGAKAFTAGLNARLRVEAVLRSVVATGTTVLLANVHRLSVQDDPEFIHQARVAVRRMRSALRLFADEVEFPPPLADGLRWIGVELGQARDLDVLAEHTLPAIAAQTGADALGPVRPSVEQMREAARQRARAAAASPRFARLALLLLQWADAEAGRSRTATLRSFAPKALRRAQRRLIDAARFFATAAPERQHRVRILAKRLRYALDLAAVALPDTCEYSDKLSALQDVLGELNDAAIALELFSQSQLPPEAIAAARSALTQRRLELSLKGEAALSELSEMPVPWR